MDNSKTVYIGDDGVEVIVKPLVNESGLVHRIGFENVAIRPDHRNLVSMIDLEEFLKEESEIPLLETLEKRIKEKASSLVSDLGDYALNETYLGQQIEGMKKTLLLKSLFESSFQ